MRYLQETDVRWIELEIWTDVTTVAVAFRGEPTEKIFTQEFR